MKQPIVLRVFKGDRLEMVRQFESGQIVIGRGTDVQLPLEDESVGLLHAMVEDRDGKFVLSDLGAESGTFLKGNRVLEESLSSGDEFQIGPYRIQFFAGAPKPLAPPKPESTIAMAPPTIPTTVDFSDTVKREPIQEAPKFKSAQSPIVSVKKGTFAPPSSYSDLKEVIKPQKGSVVEVIVAWKDRVLSTRHFSQKGSVYISSAEEADVIVPILSSKSKFELIKMGTNVSVCITQEMSGEVIREGQTLNFAELSRQNLLRNVGTHFELELRQGEMIRIQLQSGLITLYIRYVSETPKPLIAPLLDMSSSETTGVILAMAIAAILGLYMNIYTPSSLLEDEARIEEPIRKAVVTFVPRPKKIVEVEDKPPVKVVEAEQKPKPVNAPKVDARPVPNKIRQTSKPGIESKGEPGAPSEVAPKPKSKDKPKTMTSTRAQGGAIKTAPKEGANMKSEKPDPNKMGLLGAFATKGAQSKLDKAYSGSGELVGMADQATGNAGSAETRAGEGLGSKLKDTGAGGKGTSTIGIAGVGTKGRGTGGTGYGTGGIGQKGSVQINVGGQDAEFEGGMDKEAIRRVIREHLREIRNCYERELQRTPDLYGKIVLQWDIGEFGRVEDARVKSNEIGNNDVANCVISRLRTWKFPDPPKGVVGRVVYPFVFSSQ